MMLALLGIVILQQLWYYNHWNVCKATKNCLKLFLFVLMNNGWLKRPSANFSTFPFATSSSIFFLICTWLLCKTTSACALRARGFTILRELRGVNEEKILNFQSLRGEKRSNSLISRILHVFSWNSKKHHASLTRFLSFFKKKLKI